MPKRKRPASIHFFPDLSVADLDQLPRGRAGCAQLKQLEGRLLDARRELDAQLEVINRAKPNFENWMDLEIAAACAKSDSSRTGTTRTGSFAGERRGRAGQSPALQSQGSVANCHFAPAKNCGVDVSAMVLLGNHIVGPIRVGGIDSANQTGNQPAGD